VMAGNGRKRFGSTAVFTEGLTDGSSNTPWSICNVSSEGGK
jgi:hypothetical protein